MDEDGMQTLLDSEFMKIAFKDYGAPIIILIGVFVLKQIGLLDVESMQGGLSIGTYFGGCIALFIAVVIYIQSAFKKMESILITDAADGVVEVLKKLEESVRNLNHHYDSYSEYFRFLPDMYDILKGVPNKNLMYEMLVIKNKHLISNTLETILNYIVNHSIASEYEDLQRVDTILKRDLTRVFDDYIDSVKKITRNKITDEQLQIVREYLDNDMTGIAGILQRKEKKTEDKLYDTNNIFIDTEKFLSAQYQEYLGIEIPSSSGLIM